MDHGIGWSYDAFDDLPLRGQLDAAVSDRPVQLLSHDGQALWLNSKALDAAHITKRTRDPKLGVVVRDRRGEPTGLLKGAAMALAEKALPRPTREDRAKALLAAIRDGAAARRSRACRISARPQGISIYTTPRATAGTLGLRVYAAVPAARTTPEDLDAIAKRYPDDPLLKTGLATIALDGSVESQTAAMLAPYSPKGGDEGELRMPAAELSKLVAMLDARGWQIAVDAAGDRAVRLALDAYGAVAKNAQGREGAAPPHRKRHGGRCAKTCRASARWASSPRSCRCTQRAAASELVEEPGSRARAARLAVRSLSAAGAHLAFGTDSPRLPLDPLAGLRAAVTRPEMQAPEQLTLKSAINAWTSGRGLGVIRRAPEGDAQARHARRYRHPVDRHLRRHPPKLAGAEVVMTIFDGKIVYRRAS